MVKKKLLLVYLGAISALAPCSIDIYLSSMPLIEKIFNASEINTQMTIGVFFVAFAAMQIFWGPLSDRVGRKPILVCGLLIYTIASILCAHSKTIETLIALRFIQAIGVSSVPVIVMAIVKDLFKQEQVASAIRRVITVMMVTPIVAPVIGAYLLAHFSWQANFYFLFYYGFLSLVFTLIVKESYPKHKRNFLPTNRVVKEYYRQLTCKPFFLGTLAVSFSFSTMFAFVTASPFIYMGTYHLSVEEFSLLFILNASGFILSNLSVNIIRKFVKVNNIIIHIGMILSISGSLFMLIDIFSLLNTVLGAFMMTLGIGFLLPEFMAMSLKHVLQHPGIASSIIGVMRFTTAAMTSALVGIFVMSSILKLAVLMLTISLFVTFIFYYKACELKLIKQSF